MGLLDPASSEPQMEDGEPPAADQETRKEILQQEVSPYLGKLEQEGSLECPESIEEPPEEVDGLILYQTEEERSTDSSLDAEAFIPNETGEFLEMKESGADQVDEISEGQLECVSLGDAAEEPGCDRTAGTVQDAKAGLIELCESELAERCSPSGSALERTSEREGSQTDVSVDHNLNSRSEALSFSLDQENRYNLLHQNEIQTDLDLNVNDVDRKSSDVKFSVQPVGKGKKPLQFMVPVKLEVTKTEVAEEVRPDSSEVKHSHFLSFPIKSEGSAAKAEKLEFPLRAPLLDVKPEDLSLSMKSENFDVKSEPLQFVAFSDGGKIKPEIKPAELRFPVYSDGGSFKSEMKPLAGFPDAVKPKGMPDVLEFTTYPNGSGVKHEVKPEVLDFTGFPEVKVEMKREMLEADSTVLTPKLEQTEGTADASETLLKGQVKEERPSTPGMNVLLYIPATQRPCCL